MSAGIVECPECYSLVRGDLERCPYCYTSLSQARGAAPPGREHGRAPPPPPRQPPPQQTYRPPQQDYDPRPPQQDYDPRPPQQEYDPRPPGTQPYPPRAPPPYAKPVSTKGRGHFIGGLVLAILLLIAAVFGLFSTSWYGQSESALGFTVSLDYGLSEMEGNIGFASVSMNYDELEAESGTSSPIVDVAHLTKIMVYFGLILLALFIGLVLALILGKGGDSMRRAVPTLGYLTGIVLLLATIYFAIAFPNAIEEDSGSEAGGSLGAAWIAVFICSLLMLIGAEITRRAPSDREMYPHRPYYPTM